MKRWLAILLLVTACAARATVETDIRVLRARISELQQLVWVLTNCACTPLSVPGTVSRAVVSDDQAYLVVGDDELEVVIQ
jgi:hypothetical protein